MKKIIFLFITFLIFPLFSAAVDYDIKQYYINAEVKENGDVSVEELFLIDGTLNGYEMNLTYTSKNSSIQASDITDIKVYGSKLNEISFDTFDENLTPFIFVNNAVVGESKKYTVDSIYNGYSIRMYNPVNNSKSVFKLTYTLKDAVILHNNFGEFYWNFFSGDLQDEIKDLNVRVSLPAKDNSDYFRFWAHGPLAGEIHDYNTNNNNVIIANINKLEPYGTLDVRITFNSNLLNTNEIKNYSSTTLDEIIEEETIKANETNELRKEVKRKWNIALGSTIFFYIILVSSFVYIYFKYDKEIKSQFNLKYNRDFIDEYNVEVVDYLMNHKITENALSASIMNLIYKKNIKAETIVEKKDSYTFTLLNRDNCNDTENSLLDFLFNTIGNGTTFTSNELKSYASSTRTCQKFMSSYTKWKNKVIKDGQNQEFFENKKNYIWLPFLLLFFSMFLQFYIANNNVELPLAFISIVFAIIFLIYCLTCTKKTKKGIEHYAKWKAFKNFLNDFGNFSVKELPEIILWERYLVYATVFGLAQKVEKSMNVKIKEFENVDNMDFYMYNNLYNLHIASMITSSMHSAISSSQTAINRINASSSMSSGSGFGGGFSGGGGFGGGGRSGGGF